MKKEQYKWFVFYKDQLLMNQEADGYRVPFGEEPPVKVPVGSTIHNIGEMEGIPCKTYAIHTPIPGDEAPLRQMMGLRASYDELPFEEYYKAGKAFEILNWDKNTRYCPSCGVPTHQISDIGKKCPECRQEFYPHISPAIIVRITKGDSILLVHARNFRGTFYGLVAGFLEAGETLEECVHREVMEEVGLHIKNLKYFGSQPWPYPSGVMIGFTAEYESGSIKLQDEELNAGAFYTKDNLPEIPRKLSLARKLIDDWLEKE
ncbi:MAG: NAD(+) diphosphatase [Bacteroidaceae bacterium]|nr:NAD(+) diphosphatase [Bacteroidaceae bacterium]